MDDDEDDVYAPSNDHGGDGTNDLNNSNHVREEKMDDAEEVESDEDEEEDEEGDDESDIEIVTERPDGIKAEPPPQVSRPVTIKPPPPARTDSPIATTKSQPPSAIAVKVEPTTSTPQPQKPGSSYPPYRSSNIDIDADPTYEPASKALMDLDIDADLPEDDKPWRRPGTDPSDFFNYGFDEFTWVLYCNKQKALRAESRDTKKQWEDMVKVTSGTDTGMTGVGGMAGMPGMPDMPPAMMQAWQQAMASGMDPMQMDADSFAQIMNGAGQNMMGGAGFGGQGQGQQQMGGFGGGGYGGGHGNWNQGARGGRRH